MITASVSVFNRLVQWQQTQIREGFELANKDGSIYVYDVIIDLIFDFTV